MIFIRASTVHFLISDVFQARIKAVYMLVQKLRIGHCAYVPDVKL